MSKCPFVALFSFSTFGNISCLWMPFFLSACLSDLLLMYLSHKKNGKWCIIGILIYFKLWTILLRPFVFFSLFKIFFISASGLRPFFNTVWWPCMPHLGDTHYTLGWSSIYNLDAFENVLRPFFYYVTSVFLNMLRPFVFSAFFYFFRKCLKFETFL